MTEQEPESQTNTNSHTSRAAAFWLGLLPSVFPVIVLMIMIVTKTDFFLVPGLALILGLVSIVVWCRASLVLGRKDALGYPAPGSVLLWMLILIVLSLTLGAGLFFFACSAAIQF